MHITSRLHLSIDINPISPKLFVWKHRVHYFKVLLHIYNNMMKFFQTLILALSTITYSQSNICEGTLQAKNTNQKIAYANIGIVNQNLGTVTNKDGQFSLIIDEKFDNADIKISSIGFVPMVLKVSEFKKLLSQNKIITIEKAVNQLKEIVIRHKKLKRTMLGNKLGKKMVSAGFVNNVLGNEIGIKIKINQKPTFIDAFQAVVDYNKFENFKFRINIYSIKNGLPNENLLTENIIATSQVKKGLMSIDLSQYDIMVTEDFFISIELIEQLGNGGLRFLADYKGSPIITRAASQGKWNKQAKLSFGFSVVVRE